MGIARSGPSKEFPFPIVRGKNDGFAGKIKFNYFNLSLYYMYFPASTLRLK